jgi:hypothetical protein
MSTDTIIKNYEFSTNRLPSEGSCRPATEGWEACGFFPLLSRENWCRMVGKKVTFQEEL